MRKIRARGLELLPDVQRLSDLSNLSILFHQNTENDYEVKDRSINEEINALMCTKLHSMLSRTSYVDPLTLSNLAVNLIYFKPNDRDMTACLHKHIIARFDRLFNFMKCYYRISGFLRFHPFTEEEDQNKCIFFTIFSHTQWVSVALAIRLCPLSSLLSSAWTFSVFRLLSNRWICFKFCVDVLWVDPY